MPIWDELRPGALTLGEVTRLYRRDSVAGIVLRAEQARNDAVTECWLESSAAYHYLTLTDDGWRRVNRTAKGSDDDLHGAPIDAFTEPDTFPFADILDDDGEPDFGRIPELPSGSADDANANGDGPGPLDTEDLLGPEDIDGDFEDGDIAEYAGDTGSFSAAVQEAVDAAIQQASERLARHAMNGCKEVNVEVETPDGKVTGYVTDWSLGLEPPGSDPKYELTVELGDGRQLEYEGTMTLS